MTTRDPRKDPKPGDVFESVADCLGRHEFRVVRRQGEIVGYLDGAEYLECSLEEWRAYSRTDEVLRAAD